MASALNGGPAPVYLVAGSGLQVIDFELRVDLLSLNFGRFVEDVGPEGPVLIPLVDQPDYEGVEWHPAAKRPMRPDETLWLSGYSGLEPFLDTWVPLPYLRQIGVGADGAPLYDTGPSNWARVYIASACAEIRHATRLKAVVAFDTRVTDQSRLDPLDYLAPNVDDVRLGSEFRLAADTASLSALIGEKWLDSWLTGRFTVWRATGAGNATPDLERSAGFALEYVARYLALLRVLERAAELPPVRFASVLADRDRRVAETDVDLVVDIGDDRTTAVLVDRRATGDAGPLAGFETLQVRDLSQPTEVHAGSFRTLAEFNRCSFGNPVASRLSGRGDAFAWPSLVRIGAEAARLALRPSAVAGVTGLGDLRSALSDLAPRSQVWRFGRDEAEAGTDPGQIVSGEMLNYVAEDGGVLGAGGSTLPALRPRFSCASMLTMFAAELVLHALAQANAPMQQIAGAPIVRRRLQRVIVTCPADASELERRQLCGRIADGIDLIWAAFGWTAAGTPVTPAKPLVAVGLDAGLSAQLVYLFDEVHGRFGGDMRGFAGVARGHGRSARGHLTIATLDLASAATGLSVVEYDVAEPGAIRPRLLLAERSGATAAALVDRVLRDVIVEAIAQRLGQCGHPDAWRLLTTLVLDAGDAAIDRHLASRLNHKVLRPAAGAFLELCRDVAARSAGHGQRHTTLADLVERGDGRLDPLAAEIDAMAAAQGAHAFHLRDVVVRIRARDVARLIERHFEPTIGRICDIVSEHACDLVLLSGPYAGLGRAKTLLLRKLPLAPHRIVDLGLRSAPVDGQPASAGPDALRLLPLLGNALAVRGSLEAIGLAHMAPELAIKASVLLEASPSLPEARRAVPPPLWPAPRRGDQAAEPQRLQAAPIGGAT